MTECQDSALRPLDSGSLPLGNNLFDSYNEVCDGKVGIFVTPKSNPFVFFSILLTAVQCLYVT